MMSEAPQLVALATADTHGPSRVFLVLPNCPCRLRYLLPFLRMKGPSQYRVQKMPRACKGSFFSVPV